MFELFSGEHRQTPHADTVPMLISSVVHVLVVGAVVVLPVLYVSDQLPEAPDMLAFVAAPPPPPPPPPPPAPPPPVAGKPLAARPVPTTGQLVAPLEAPAAIVAESGFDDGSEGGVPGGVEGGVPGGVLGGIVGGLPSDLPPPPPPGLLAMPPPAPIRTGGEIQPPALVHRVNPVYPDIAVTAQIEGVVILEAIVDREGRVEDLRVLRSIPLLDKAAIAAVQQWRYAPLLLNGKPERFVLTVSVSFRLTR